jgi:hypothetical protein
MLTEIVEQLEAAPEVATEIPVSQVHRWMDSKDIDILGATSVFLSKAACVRRVYPHLSFEQVFNFLLPYYVRCLREDPDSEWANSRYSAGWDMVRWFVSMWDDEREIKYLEVIKSSLAELYREGPPELRLCIEVAIIEHMFEREEIRKFFEAWKDDPALGSAYDGGILWIEGGGTSPLSKKLPPHD